MTVAPATGLVTVAPAAPAAHVAPVVPSAGIAVGEPIGYYYANNVVVPFNSGKLIENHAI